MDPQHYRSSRKNTMRDRVNRRHKQEEHWQNFRQELSQITIPTPKVGEKAAGVLRQARDLRRPSFLSGRVIVCLAAVALLAACLLVVIPRIFSPGQKANAFSLSGKGRATPTNPVMPLTETIVPDRLTRILIFGSDQREDDPGFRTDVVVLVTIDTHLGKVSMVSFPRDLAVKMPGYGEQRVNVGMGYGGFELMQNTFEQDFGVRPAYYFMTNFENFTGVINSIGGVEVNVAQPLTNSCDLVINRDGQCTFKPGKHVMDGATALWYIRSRHSSSDFDRLRRAQEVLTATLSRLKDMNAFFRLPELYTQYKGDIETNMSLPQMAGLMPVAIRVMKDPGRINRYTISPNEATDWWTAEGAEVLLPNYEAIRKIIQQASFQAP